jgi:tetratricopeptide (TPR) repeat protein
MILDVKTNRSGRSASESPKKAAPAPDAADLAEAIALADVEALGVRIKQSRLDRSMTQAEAAAGIISPAYLSRIEAGARRPDLKVLRALSEKLDCSVHEWLIGLSPKQWSERRVELDWAQLSLRTGDALGALKRVEALLADIPPGSRLARRALFTQGLALEATGDYQQAAAVLEDLLDAETEGAPTLDAMTALSRVYRECGELSRAKEVGDRADRRIAALDMAGSPEAVKLTLTVAAAHCEAGDVMFAARMCQRALKHAESLRNPSEKAACYWNASIIESRSGNHEEAVALGQKALFVLDEADSTRNTARLRTQLGLLYLRLAPPLIDEALESLRGCEPDLLASEASPADLASNRIGQARALFYLGDFAEADKQASEALALAENSPLLVCEAQVLRGRIAFDQDQHDIAQERYLDAAETLKSIGADRGAAQLWYELGSLLRAIGRDEEAMNAYERAASSTGLQRRGQSKILRPAPRDPEVVAALYAVAEDHRELDPDIAHEIMASTR